MIIREFRLNDLHRVYEIQEVVIPNPYNIDILKKLFDFGTGFLVAQINEKVVGYIIFWIIEEDRGHIVSLAVDPDYKRQKIGSRLIKNAIATFMRFSIFNITLEVNAENKEALDFYRSVGFKIYKKISNYYEDGADAYKMSIDFFMDE